jgi:hypothetical protein
MRAVVMHAPGDVRVDLVDEPTIVEPTDAIIRVTAACGRGLQGHGRAPRRQGARHSLNHYSLNH